MMSRHRGIIPILLALGVAALLATGPVAAADPGSEQPKLTQEQKEKEREARLKTAADGLEKLYKPAIPNIKNLQPTQQHPAWDPGRDAHYTPDWPQKSRFAADNAHPPPGPGQLWIASTGSKLGRIMGTGIARTRGPEMV